MIVADTNLLAYLLLEGEHTDLAEQVLERDSHWIVPVLWRSEFRNILALYLRRDLLDLATARRLMEYGETLVAEREHTLPSALVLALVARSDCSAYDCEFVALAELRRTRLVTSDRKVLRAFPEVAISPRDFLAAPEISLP